MPLNGATVALTVAPFIAQYDSVAVENIPWTITTHYTHLTASFPGHPG